MTSALTRETFYRPFTIDSETVEAEVGLKIDEVIEVSAPLAERIREILTEAE